MKIKKKYSDVVDNESSFLKKITFLFVSLGYIGFISFAPGTFASFVATLISSIIIFNFGLETFIIFTILISIVGTYLTFKAQEYTPDDDPPYIVIDEFIGQAIALIIVFFIFYSISSLDLSRDSNSFLMIINLPAIQFINIKHVSYVLYIKHMYVYYILAFITFRVFDILKPSIVGIIDRNIKGYLGIILDDVVAGVFAGILSFIILIIFYNLYLVLLYYNELTTLPI